MVRYLQGGLQTQGFFHTTTLNAGRKIRQQKYFKRKNKEERERVAGRGECFFLMVFDREISRSMAWSMGVFQPNFIVADGFWPSSAKKKANFFW